MTSAAAPRLFARDAAADLLSALMITAHEAAGAASDFSGRFMRSPLERH